MITFLLSVVINDQNSPSLTPAKPFENDLAASYWAFITTSPFELMYPQLSPIFTAAKSPEEMQQMVLKIEHQILPEAVRLYCDGKLEVKDERVEIK